MVKISNRSYRSRLGVALGAIFFLNNVTDEKLTVFIVINAAYVGKPIYHHLEKEAECVFKKKEITFRTIMVHVNICNKNQRESDR